MSVKYEMSSCLEFILILKMQSFITVDYYHHLLRSVPTSARVLKCPR